MSGNKKKAKKPQSKKRGKSQQGGLRRLARIVSLSILGAWLALSVVGDWYVHHNPDWIKEKKSFFTRPLEYFGYRFAVLTDAIGITGHDTVYTFDEEAPEGQIFFAGAPVRIGNPAPKDVVTITHNEFAVGWSPSLKHPVWAAYHVTPKVRHEDMERPNFQKDKSAKNSPPANAYARSGYDRGHMVPNHAIVSRYGVEEQKLTFLMSNIAPQTANLNRGVWREMEHRIADLWAQKYGELWIIVGNVSSHEYKQTIGGYNINVPDSYYMIIIGQTGDEVRSLAVLLPQETPYGTYPLANIVTIKELEEISGFDFLPDLPKFIQRPLESDRPTRLWPIRLRDIFKLASIRFN
jgi:endonuclease G